MQPARSFSAVLVPGVFKIALLRLPERVSERQLAGLAWPFSAQDWKVVVVMLYASESVCHPAL